MNSRGFAIPSAIFLLVIFALLGAYMMSFSSTQHMAAAQDLQGARAYRAASMGLEWAVAKLCNGSGCATPLTSCAGVDGASLTADGFAVAVQCQVNTYQEAGPTGTIYVFYVTATANAGGAVGSLGFVERQVNGFIEFSS